MTKKRYTQRTSGLAAKVAALGCVSFALVCCIGLGIASAGMGAPADVDSFGIDAMSRPAASDDGGIGGNSNNSISNNSNGNGNGDDAIENSADQAASLSVSEAPATSVLVTPASRDISQGIAAIEAEEEAERRAAEEKKRAEDQAHIDVAEAAKARQQAEAARESVAGELASLPDVDWTVGEERFLAEWTERIDAYLAGSNLEGKGAVFARAAWENGVDPRWSPAISNTESSKGAHCFLPYNAWGWGEDTWTNWDDAINAHVAGLAGVYGYSVTYANASKYCPPNTKNWFYNTLEQMKSI